MSLQARVAWAAAVCVLLVVVFLHNPFDGWEYGQTNWHTAQLPCTKDTYKSLRREGEVFTEQEVQAWITKCSTPVGEWEYWPFREWRASGEPVLPWFGSVRNALTLLGFAFTGIAVLYRLFRPATPAPD